MPSAFERVPFVDNLAQHHCLGHVELFCKALSIFNLVKLAYIFIDPSSVFHKKLGCLLGVPLRSSLNILWNLNIMQELYFQLYRLCKWIIYYADYADRLYLHWIPHTSHQDSVKIEYLFKVFLAPIALYLRITVTKVPNFLVRKWHAWNLVDSP